MRYCYSRWNGAQAGIVPDAETLLDSFADELLAGADLQQLLQHAMQRGLDVGGERIPGLRDLLERIRAERDRELAKYDVDTVLDDISDELRKVAELERAGLHGHDVDTSATTRSQRTPDRRSPDPGAPTGPQPELPPGEPAAPDEKDRNQNPGIGCDCCGTGGGGCCDSGGGGQGGAPSPNPKPGDQDVDARQSGVLVSGGDETTGEAAPNGKGDLRRILSRFTSRRRSFLDGLPAGPAAQLAAFAGYDFVNPDAWERLRRLQSRLAERMKRHYLPDLIETDRFGEVMHALGRSLQEEAGGATGALEELDELYRDTVGGTTKDLAAAVRRQVALMQSLLASLTPEVRAQLEQLTAAVLRDDLAQWELAWLQANLARSQPTAAPRAYRFRGRRRIDLSEALDLMARLDRLERLQRELTQAAPVRLEELDADELRSLLGEEAYQALTALQEMCRVLERAGYLERRGARVVLTARGIRKLGDRAARDIFTNLQRDPLGRHGTGVQGTGFDRVDDRKIHAFGDPFLLDVEETIRNAVAREGPGCPVRLAARDFVVHRNEASVRVATVLMIDLSRSMRVRGCFTAARRVALALHSLIRARFPQDTLYLVGFSDRARELTLDALPDVSWDDRATNMQDGFRLARHLLARHRAANREIVMVTDGEPTAHLEGDRVEFSYPPSPATIDATLLEVCRCARERIVINTFMLQRAPYLMDLVDRMARLNRGRALYAAPERLGEYVLCDYLANRKSMRT